MSYIVVTTLLIGIGATLVMDLWTLMLQRLGVKTLDYAMLGRWAGHLLRGQWRHQAIVRAAPIAHERRWGWSIHYAVGLVFAGLLVVLAGPGWLTEPRLGPALLFGLVSVLVPLCVMQPAMGAGMFSRNTPTPVRNCLRSVMTHCVFGVGLYLSAWTLGNV